MSPRILVARATTVDPSDPGCAEARKLAHLRVEIEKLNLNFARCFLSGAREAAATFVSISSGGRTQLEYRPELVKPGGPFMGNRDIDQLRPLVMDILNLAKTNDVCVVGHGWLPHVIVLLLLQERGEEVALHHLSGEDELQLAEGCALLIDGVAVSEISFAEL